MIVPPARILGVHAIVGPVDRWIPEGIAVRVLMHPLLGIPLGPLAVSVVEFREDPITASLGFSGSGPGWRGFGDVDGVAWLRLDQPAGETRPPIIVRLDGDFDANPKVSVVRWPGDSGQGISAVHAPPYILSAPTVRTLRVEGRCSIKNATVSRAEVEFIPGTTTTLGLPLGRVGQTVMHRPRYLGHDPTGSDAFERVRRGAPLMHGPHELPTPDAELNDPELARDAELERVKQLVFDGGRDVPLADRLLAIVGQPQEKRRVPTRVQDLIADSPKATGGTLASLDSILAAAGEPGIARWMGFATLLDPPQQPGTNVISITVAGRWLLPNERWASWVSRFSDQDSVQGALSTAGLGDQVNAVGVGMLTPWLWTQARIDLRVPPDPPEPPSVVGRPPGVWMTRNGSDVVRLPLALGGIVPLAQVGLAQLGDGDPVPTQPEIPGLPERSRPLLAADGTGVDLVFPAPPDDGGYAFRAWQADMFGRWSDGTDVDVAGPVRPGLPVPEVRWFHDPEEALPVGDGPFVPRIRVIVPVPDRTAGQPEIVAVSAALDDAAPTQLAPSIPSVEFTLDGDPLARAATSTQRLVVRFSGSSGPPVAAQPIDIVFVDPRPPIPPARPRVLLFTDPPDASGRAAYRIPLPAGQGIEGWRIFVTTESRLLRTAATDGLTAPASTLSRNDRALAWIDKSTLLKRERFDCVTPAVISGPAPFRASLPGTLAEVVLVRPVPQRRGGAEPDFATCPVMAFAVPFAVAPPAPDVTLDRSVAPPVIRIRARQGVVAASEYRMRLATSLLDDPRAAVIVASGQLTAGAAVVPMPALRPFATAYAIAEVLAEMEPGKDPRPTLWSAPSAPVQLVIVPDGPPVLTGAPTAEIVAGGTLRITVPVPGLATTPTPGPYRVRLFRRSADGDPWEMAAEAPVSGVSAVVTVPPQPGASFQVALVDPLGRASAPIAVPAP